MWREYVGGYTDWERTKAEAAARTMQKPASKLPEKAGAKAAPAKAKKRSY